MPLEAFFPSTYSSSQPGVQAFFSHLRGATQLSVKLALLRASSLMCRLSWTPLFFAGRGWPPSGASLLLCFQKSCLRPIGVFQTFSLIPSMLSFRQQYRTRMLLCGRAFCGPVQDSFVPCTVQDQWTIWFENFWGVSKIEFNDT